MNCFNPEDYDNDIIVVEMQSLGRGRGFEKIGEYSALDDAALMGRIADRLHALLKLIEGDPPNPLMVENVQLEDQVEELEDDARAILLELETAKGRIRDLEKETESHDELLFMVNEALEDIYAVGFGDLNSAVKAMVEEFDDLREELEDEVLVQNPGTP